MAATNNQNMVWKGFKLINTLLFLVFVSPSFAQKFTRIENQANFNDLRNTMGVAVADFDRDNDLDLFIVGKSDFSPIEPTTWSRLFRNNNDGTFEDVTIAAGFHNLHNYDIKDPGWEYGVKMGASWGDYNNDGFPDLFLTNYRSIQLFQNQKDGTFKEVTKSAGFPVEDDCYNTSALWWDFNKDGFLDIYISKWGGCESNRFYENNSDGTFTEKTEELNIGGLQEWTWMTVPLDANHDGRWDLYLANDFTENELLIQDSNGVFSNKALQYLANYKGNDMGIALGDYDNDGAFDIYITNIGENRLLSPTGNNTYENVADSKNVLDAFWAWDTQFADFDHDGDEDLFVSNGYQSDFVFYPSKKDNFLFKNLQSEGQNTFEDWSEQAQVKDFSSSMSMRAFDYDLDGDLDIMVSNMDNSPFFYENNSSESEGLSQNNWANIQLEGTVSNRDGLGSHLKLYSNNNTQHRLYNGAGLLSQSLSAVHFGLGNAPIIDSLEITWDSGITEKFYALPVNEYIKIKEQEGYSVQDIRHNKIYGCTDPQSCNFNPLATVNDGSCSYWPPAQIIGNNQSGYLNTEIYSYPENEGSSYHWNVEHGEILSGQGSPTVTVKWELENQGQISVREINTCASDVVNLEVSLSFDKMNGQQSIARLWNEALLYAIRKDYARPTVHARNLFHASVAMYDSWAVYDEEARTYLLGKNVHGYESQFSDFPSNEPIEEARRKTLSYAAFRLLTYRFSKSPGVEKSNTLFERLMMELGYDTGIQSADYSTGDPAALGNFIAQTIINFGNQDGSNELGEYGNLHYKALNPPLVTNHSGNPSIRDPNRWQPLALETFIDQSGNFIEGSTPDFLSPEWGKVVPFSLQNDSKDNLERGEGTYHVYHNPGAPPFLDTLLQNEGNEQYQWGFSLVSIWGAHLSPYDGVLWDISPKSIGNISLNEFPSDFSQYPDFYKKIEGGDISKGRSVNPKTGNPYAEQIVPRGDYTRVLAEFWADGPDSETPPGHWFVILNTVSDSELLEKRLGGEGAEMSNLEWDVKSYFILGGAMHDAAIAAWSIKGWYDYIRPISAIRYMAGKGQSSDPLLPSYHIAGIPLEEGYVELVEEGDELAGPDNEHVGKIKVYTWRGHNYLINPETDEAGVGWILAENWMPYQRPSFVTPPFAGYVSGHSTFSRAAAEVMTLLTGDEFFPGGIGEFIAYKNEFLVFEEGPSVDVKLQWATYRDASDQCSLSRIWGGIHPPADDIPGRRIGEKIGRETFSFAVPYFSSITTSTNDNSNLQSSLIYPNPASPMEVINLTNTTSQVEVKIYNIQGQEIPLIKQRFNPNLNTTSLEIPNINPGVYIVSSKNKTWKLVIL